MRDFKEDPAWRAEETGLPLPDSLHACSVSLPTWESTIGYEEGDPEVLAALQCGYPRFLLNPLVERLFAEAEAGLAREGEKVVVFPRPEVAELAADFAAARGAGGQRGRVEDFRGLGALVHPAGDHQLVRDYWKHAGQVVSSRQAEDVLSGAAAPADISGCLARLAGVMESAGDDLFLYESGMSAIAACHRVVTGARPGRPTLQVDFPYVDALKVQEELGSGVEFLPDGTGERLRQVLPRVRAGEFAGVFCEIPSNPLLRSIDLVALSRACREGATPLLVDDTVASHRNLAVFPHADLATTSLTKWVSGKGDVMAGGVRVNPDAPGADELRSALLRENPDRCVLYGRDVEALAANSAGFAALVDRANASGEIVADYLSEHPSVDEVWYPKFGGKAEYDALLRPGGGYGGLISFSLRRPERAPAVYDALRWSKGPSLGTEFSLACAYTLLAHYRELEWAEECGVPRNLIRLSVGAEDPEQLVSALADALSRA
jgi:cystathionine gamma-synthase